MDKISMSITVGCDSDGVGGTVQSLAKSAFIMKGATEIGNQNETPLAYALAAAHRRHGGAKQEPNPDYRPNALSPEDRGSPTIEVPGMTPAECLVYALRLSFESLVAEQVSHLNELAKQQKIQAEQQALLSGAKVV